MHKDGRRHNLDNDSGLGDEVDHEYYEL